MLNQLYFFYSGNELPPLLLRDDETAHRAVAMRAAQVLCTQVGCPSVFMQHLIYGSLSSVLDQMSVGLKRTVGDSD